MKNKAILLILVLLLTMTTTWLTIQIAVSYDINCDDIFNIWSVYLWLVSIFLLGSYLIYKK